MPPQIGIVADDLTGAADTGVAFLTAGLSVVVAWLSEQNDREPISHAADVIAIDTRSRAANAEHARRVTSELVSRFREAGTATLYKKIDSTLRGHIAVEVEAAIRAWQAGSLAIVAPAFPATGRTTVGGLQRVGGVPLGGHASVPALFEQAGLSTLRADLARVRSAALESVLTECRNRAADVVVCDAETDEDLRAIAQVGARLGPAVVWVGSGGLARAMAAEIGETGRRAPTMTRASGPIVIVVGSRNVVARAQADDLVAAGVERINLPASALHGGPNTGGADIARTIEARLLAGKDLVLTIGSEASDTGADDPRLTERLGQLLRRCATGAGALILTGGDTAVGVLQAWGTTAVRLVEEIGPGVVLSETIGSRPMPVVTKAGSFGDRGTLTTARQWLRRGRQ
jgi:4-hydroxythreonine-4-phosphate dehydrogenase